MTLAGGPRQFDVRSEDLAADRLLVGTSLEWTMAPDVSAKASYLGTFAANQNDHAGAVRLAVGF